MNNIYLFQVFRSLEILLLSKQTLSSPLSFILPFPESHEFIIIDVGLLISIRCWGAEFEQK